MPRRNQRQNEGPCTICGRQGSDEKFRKLTGHLLARIKESTDISYKPGGANNRLSMRSQGKMMNIDMNDLTMTKDEREKELIESDKEERVYYEEALEDSNDKLLDDVNFLIENNTESISKVKDKGKLTNKGIEPKELSQIVEENDVSKDDYNIQSIELIYDQFRSSETID
ncbi:13838_t:CDS:2, partial [Racocetra fulgida]